MLQEKGWGDTEVLLEKAREVLGIVETETVGSFGDGRTTDEQCLFGVVRKE